MIMKQWAPPPTHAIMTVAWGLGRGGTAACPLPHHHHSSRCCVEAGGLSRNSGCEYVLGVRGRRDGSGGGVVLVWTAEHRQYCWSPRHWGLLRARGRREGRAVGVEGDCVCTKTAGDRRRVRMATRCRGSGDCVLVCSTVVKGSDAHDESCVIFLLDSAPTPVTLYLRPCPTYLQLHKELLR
jgi:hypothetical protein